MIANRPCTCILNWAREPHPQRVLGRSVMRECLRVNRMPRLVGEQEAWTDLPSEPSAHQILRLGSRVMRYERVLL